MTDKQIIFKCDVDCTLKNTEECLELDCIKGQESILKQLQAKEQECDMWKNLTVDNGAVALKYQQQLDQLKAENNELKKFLKDGGLYNLSLMAEKRVLLQTLTEIKELIQSEYCIVIGSCEICDEVGDCINGKILQKISEVIPDEKS